MKPVYVWGGDEELKKQAEILNLKVKELEKQLENQALFSGDYLQHFSMGPGAEHWKRSHCLQMLMQET